MCGDVFAHVAPRTRRQATASAREGLSDLNRFVDRLRNVLRQG